MRKAVAILCVLTVPGAATLAVAQDGGPYPQSGPPQQAAPQSTPLLTPEQLDNLVAPIALYPDPLLGQVLAAATYPLEIVEAQQWLNQNRGLRGQALIDAAKQQNWDPSVAALIAFPDAMALLDRDIQWTTDLGNAFLAQQADVMSAIQRMRARAQQNGRLQSTAQETVAGDPGAIQIQPADPQYVYVPVYNPVYVWGPPAWGYYPPLWYPPVSYGCGFGAGVFLGGLFAGFLGFGGWGWGLSWVGHGLFLNGLFFNHYGFGGYHGYGGRGWWAHDPVHRMGVAYPNRTLAARYGGVGGRAYAGGYSPRAYGGNRSYSGGQGRSFGNTHNNFAGGGSRSPMQNSRNYSAPRNYSGNSYRAPQQNFNARGFNGSSNRSPQQNFNSRGSNGNSYRAPQQNFNSARNFGGNSYRAPQQNSRSLNGGNSFRAPQSNTRSSSAPHYSAPRTSGGGHFGGGGGGHSGGGGGHSSGGHSGGGSHRR